MTYRQWLLAIPTVLFFTLLGAAVMSSKETVLYLDNAGALIGLVIGLVVGVLAVVVGMKGDPR